MPRRRKTTRRGLSTYQKCIGKELKGRKFRGQAQVRAAFKKAVAKCK